MPEAETLSLHHCKLQAINPRSTASLFRDASAVPGNGLALEWRIRQVSYSQRRRSGHFWFCFPNNFSSMVIFSFHPQTVLLKMPVPLLQLVSERMTPCRSHQQLDCADFSG